jgi:hypothetical protein
MTYIELEYDNIPEHVTPEMEAFFEECFSPGSPTCLPNAAGLFYERFLKTPEIL